MLNGWTFASLLQMFIDRADPSMCMDKAGWTSGVIRGSMICTAGNASSRFGLHSANDQWDDCLPGEAPRTDKTPRPPRNSVSDACIRCTKPGM